jgi:hypothetical protein
MVGGRWAPCHVPAIGGFDSPRLHQSTYDLPVNMNKASAGKVAVTLFWHAVDIVCYGVAFKYLWGWFGQPTFHTPSLTWGTSFGLVLIARLLVEHHGEERAITLQNVFVEALIPALFLEAGFLIKHFMTM